MQRQLMDLVNPGQAFGRHTDQHIGVFQQRPHGPWLGSTQGNDHHVAIMGGLDGAQHIGRLGLRGNHQQYIARQPQGPHLPAKDGSCLKQVVQPRDDRRIGAQGKCREFRAIPLESTNQRRHKRLHLTRRDTAATRQHFAAPGQTSQQRRHRRLHMRRHGWRALVLQVGAVNEMLLDALQKHIQIIPAATDHCPVTKTQCQ